MKGSGPLIFQKVVAPRSSIPGRERGDRPRSNKKILGREYLPLKKTTKPNTTNM